jgi:formylglycine-generating enzyme required for sulfatase activity
VTIAYGFWLFDTPCTQALWEAVTGDTPSRFKSPTRPVESVSFDDVGAFIEALNRRVDGLNLTLPSEAEWEYACRAGTTTRYQFGDDPGSLGEYAWFSGNSDTKTHPVGQKRPNVFGLHDMHGNVWEWCSDGYDKYSTQSPVDDPKGPSQAASRVFRGGCWNSDPRLCRSADRDGYAPGYRGGLVGFRVARVR